MPSSTLRQALACFGRGEFDRAAACCRRALAAGEHPVEAALLLGEAELARGRAQEALVVLRQALAQAPEDAQIEQSLGEAHLALGQWQQAITHLRHALSRRPDATGWHALGEAHRRSGEVDAACEAWRRALDVDSNHVPTLAALAQLHLERGEAERAEGLFRHALEKAPGEVALGNGLAVALEAQGRFQEALACLWPLRRQAAHIPELANNLGLLHQHLGMPQAALRWYAQARALAPEAPELQWNEALCRLQSGDFRRGWRLFESRWRLPGLAPARRDLPAPRWDGRPLNGETVLLHAEQGLGDSLQFCRFAPQVAARGARVILECQPSLVPLLRTLPGVETVVTRGRPLPPFQFHCPLMSLPLVLDLTLADLPAAPIPYLHADPARMERWRMRLPRDGRPRVGLVWAGNPRRHDPVTGRIDRRRSLPLELLTPLLRRDDIAWIALQRDEAAERARPLLARHGIPNLGPALADFADTAAVVTQLDLVLAVDTAIVHLAGALGRPVWVMSRFDACWRWLHERTDSPWYPGLRLFRQPRPGDWEAVVQQVGLALDEARLQAQ